MVRQISEERINVFQIALQFQLCEYTTPQAHRHVCNSNNMDARGSLIFRVHAGQFCDFFLYHKSIFFQRAWTKQTICEWYPHAVQVFVCPEALFFFFFFVSRTCPFNTEGVVCGC